jgi:hypothetical protein
MNVPDSTSKAKDAKVLDDANEIPYRELRKDLRSAQVNDVDVYFDPDYDQAAKVNWKSIGSVTPEAAIKFANDIIKAANNAKQITAKYKGKKISY